MITASQIVKGEASYTLEELYQDTHDLFDQMKEPGVKSKERMFYTFFLFIMFSAEEKTPDEMADLFHMTPTQVTEGQEAFKEQIDLCRAIHMRKFLDVYRDYMATTSMTLQIVNLWIKDFLKQHITEDDHGTT